MRDNRSFISKNGLFANDGERQDVLKVYDEGIRDLEALMKQN